MNYTLQQYEELSGKNFSIPSIKKKFHEELYGNGIPETNLKIITAKENQTYLGQYSQGSQFRDGFKTYINLKLITEETEKQYSDNFDKDIKDFTPNDRIQIANDIEKNIMDTLWHEYAHAIYESLSESENNKEFFNNLNVFFGNDEEEFAESFCRLYSSSNKKAIQRESEKPLNVETSILFNAANLFAQENFFPENIQDCSNPNRKQFFIKDCFLLGFQEEVKYNIEGKYDKKVHEAFLKNEIRILSNSFDNQFSIVYINTQERGHYPLIKISGANNNEQNTILIDSAAKNSRLNEQDTYTLDEVSNILVPSKKKSSKL